MLFCSGSIPIVHITGESVLTVTSEQLSYVFDVLTKSPNCKVALSKKWKISFSLLMNYLIYYIILINT